MDACEARKQSLDVLVGVDIATGGQSQGLPDGPAEDIQLALLGIDSMKIVDVGAGLKERVGREISIEELVEIPTVNSLADHFVRERVIVR